MLSTIAFLFLSKKKTEDETKQNKFLYYIKKHILRPSLLGAIAVGFMKTNTPRIPGAIL